MFHFRLMFAIVAFGLAKPNSATYSPSTVPSYKPTPTTDVIPGRFCATFDSTMTGGVGGYFGLDIQNNTGRVWYNLDFSNYTNPGSCDFSKGLKYHIHTAWKNYGTYTSSSSCANAVKHYDPDLACSGQSEEWDGFCKASGRRSNYNCNSAIYSSGLYHACEVGDLSGKLGIATAGGLNKRIFATDPNKDPLLDHTPPYLFNYGVNSAYLKPWGSIVFHCNSAANSAALVCAKIVKATEGSPCAQMPHYPYSFDPNQLNSIQKDAIYNNNNTAIALIVISVGVVLVIYIILALQSKAQKEAEEKERIRAAASGAVDEQGHTKGNEEVS